ncbi:MAG: hypothetical protein M3071_10735 [Actinomycetota bacterium]|nr:hypothetical protein [Actinomycetota bacterium]
MPSDSPFRESRERAHAFREFPEDCSREVELTPAQPHQPVHTPAQLKTLREQPAYRGFARGEREHGRWQFPDGHVLAADFTVCRHRVPGSGPCVALLVEGVMVVVVTATEVLLQLGVELVVAIPDPTDDGAASALSESGSALR